MSFGFSVGAVGQLLAKPIGALKSDSGSSQHYQELISEFDNFQRTLLEAEQKCHLPISQSPFQGTTINAIKDAIWLCKAPIEKFLEKIENYRARLKKGGSGSRMMDSWRKMGWALFKEEDEINVPHRVSPGKHQEVVINQIAAQNTELKNLRLFGVGISLRLSFVHALNSFLEKGESKEGFTRY
ncbi:hypothetical protein BDD12DRAFT_803904 [Trichophaea hybrida]|nr:hypothetical protein BDD12DRAFT_803904 [Trichophaea hybrida]